MGEAPKPLEQFRAVCFCQAWKDMAKKLTKHVRSNKFVILISYRNGNCEANVVEIKFSSIVYF